VTQQASSSAAAPPACVSVFVCDDDDGAPLVCLFSAQLATLTAVRVTRDAATGEPTAAAPLFSCVAADAVPLAATRRPPGAAAPGVAAPRDLLLLSPDGALSLHVGRVHACDCAVTAPVEAPAAPVPARTPQQPAQPPPVSAAAAATPRAATPGSDSDDCDMDLGDAPTPGPPAPASPAMQTQPTPAAPSGSALGAAHMAAAQQRTVVGLRDACGARVSVVLSDGTTLRCVALPKAHLHCRAASAQPL
jgi:hypothetical protein